MAGNLVKPLLSLYGTEWRDRGYGLRRYRLAESIPWPIVRTMKIPEVQGLRSKENEASQQYKYVEDLCAELELAVLRENTPVQFLSFVTKNQTQKMPKSGIFPIHSNWVIISRQCRPLSHR